jgi:hypothetical protein
VVKVKIGNNEYIITPLPPRLAPHNAFYSELLQRKPSSVQEAEEIGASIKELTELVLKATVTPTPPEEHYTQLYNAVTELTNKVLSQSFFPTASKQGSVLSSPNKQTSQ